MKLTSSLLFLATALVGVLAAYDRSLAWDRFMLIALGMAGAGLLAWLGRRDRDKSVVGGVAYAGLWLAGALGVLFLFGVERIAGVDASVVRSLHPASPLLSIGMGNATGDALALLIALGSGALLWLWRRRSNGRWPLVLLLLGLIPLAVALAALVATGSRAAWLGLLLGGLCAIYAAWRVNPERSTTLRTIGDALCVLIFVLLIAASLTAIFAPTVAQRIIGVLANDASAASRITLWNDSLPLLQDYRFTGSGLGSTAMVYASYVFLLHVVYLQHAHQLYIQIALEQGLPALVAFGWMVVAAILSARRALRVGVAPVALVQGGIAALVALLVHGLLDTEIYASGLVSLLFAPFAVLWALEPSDAEWEAATGAMERSPIAGRVVLALLPVASVLALALLPGARAAFQSNLGAVRQTQAELSVYSWPQWPVQDALRRDPSVNLDDALTRYAAALRLNANNVTAHRRLGQIALSRGDTTAARLHLEQAFAAAPDQRTTRQLLGEVYALDGNAEGAAALWQGLEIGQGQMDVRHWWISQVGTPQQLAAFERALARTHTEP
jgi:O-antigen ligase